MCDLVDHGGDHHRREADIGDTDLGTLAEVPGDPRGRPLEVRVLRGDRRRRARCLLEQDTVKARRPLVKSDHPPDDRREALPKWRHRRDEPIERRPAERFDLGVWRIASS
jgi:hypothetical protein